jgi:hypothetical protein
MNSYEFTRYWHSRIFVRCTNYFNRRAKLLNFLKTFLVSIATSLNSMRKAYKIKAFFLGSSISWSLRNMYCIKGLRLANLVSNMWIK